MTSLTQTKLADAIKWRAHNLFSLYERRLRYGRIIWQTYETLRITSAILEWKNKKQIQETEIYIDLDFQTDHVLQDSIITLCTPYNLSLIIIIIF